MTINSELDSVCIANPCIDAVFQYGFSSKTVTRHFLNTIFEFKDGAEITEVELLRRDLLSHNPTGPLAYNFTVDVRCKTKDGRYFLIEMQNDFRNDYHLKALIEHSRMISGIDQDRSSSDLEDKRNKFWKDIQGVYSLVITNKVFSATNMKEFYPKEPLMEPDLINTYELRHTRDLTRHFGDIPNQLTLFMLANLVEKPIKDMTAIEKWAYIFHEKALRQGAVKIPETKKIEHLNDLTEGDVGMKEFIGRLDYESLPDSVYEQYHSKLKYYNDSITDIEDKAEARGLEKGEAIGVEKGGMEKALEIAKKMLADKMPLEVVIKYSGLTEKQIKGL